ncbi:HipA domain-containing protein [Winogradskyella sp.]|uniref:HipA domain-containing protein n=1 Tax=Winogradskyella sp. TaxID=1883156 RepID=UPI0026104A6A|nr:HipA domain-containing protein [Winogradskyella sp.]
MVKCLYCYKEINDDEFKTYGFHKACSRKFFGKNTPPLLDYTQDEMLMLAERVVKSQRTVTGVQPKLSLNRKKMTGNSATERFTIVGLWGKFILKPQTQLYEQLPEIEDLTMQLAASSKIKTVEHSLIRLKSGQLAYITKRIDRPKDRKLHMEDMCQLTERLTEHKYKGSYEQIAKTIKAFSANPGFDVVNFYELVLFCFLTGNNDMHLKNFSLLKDVSLNYNLCPAYDLVASELVVEGDDEELALNLNGKKKRLKRQDFFIAMKTSGMNEKSIENVFNKFQKQRSKWYGLIDSSFLTDEFKENYRNLIDRKFEQLEFEKKLK